MGFDLKQVVPWGRSFDEYCDMFALHELELKSSILGVGDGPAAFNAELTRRHGRIISVDPLYRFSRAQIALRIDEIFPDMLTQVEANAPHLHLEKFGSVQALGQTRMQAMQQFLEDFDLGCQQQRYIDASLPKLPFTDQQFDLALCSHLLFLYSEQLDAEFHLQSLLEMCRVAATVKIFPLLDLQHHPSAHLDFVKTELEHNGLQATFVNVDYEFQKGANQMLQITRA